MTDDDRTLDTHLLRGMEAELVTTRDELARAAAHNADVEAELFAVAKRLTAKEAEHEAALKALKKLHDELFDARAELDKARAEAFPAPRRGLAGRAVRKVIRTVRK